MRQTLLLAFCAFLINNLSASEIISSEEDNDALYTIEGRVFSPEMPFPPANWQVNTKLMVNGGENLGFIKEDGAFTIHNIKYGSYIVEIVNPDYYYEPVRVEINSKGRYRARKVNLIQTSQVIQVPYPLKLKPMSKIRYFQVREQWRVTDFLFNPMVLMMVLPLLLIMVLPKMMSDPETKKEMEQFGSLTGKFEMPEMSEIMTNWFPGAQQPKTAAAPKAVKGSKKRA